MPSVTTFLQPKNNARSAAVGAIDGATDPVTFSVTTSEGALFPATASGPFMISIDNEILKCTSRTADALTCSRAQESTSIVAHLLGASVQLRVTAGIITEIQQNVKVGILEGWVADNAQNPSLGTLPANAFVLAVFIWVEEAFNSDAADEISVGYDAAATAYATATDVSATGVKSPTLGTTARTVDPTSRAVEAYYVNGGTEPTTGRAHVAVHYIVATPVVA